MASNEMTSDEISNDINASIWLKKYSIQKDWILRHIPAPWDKSIRVSPLTIAAYEDNIPMVKWFLDKKCAAIPANRIYPLRVAIQKGSMKTIELLRDKFGDDLFTLTEPEVEDSHHDPSHRSSLKHHASSKPPIKPTLIGVGLGHAVPGDSLLHSACRTGCLESFRYLWEMLYEREEVALSFNLLKDGQYLGSLSGRLSHRFRNEVTGDELLHAAVHGQSAELIEYLIEQLRLEDDSSNDSEAKESETKESDGSSLRSVRSVPTQSSPSQVTQSSFSQSYASSVKPPLGLNAQNSGGYTPFTVACKAGHLGMAQHLYDAGADIHIKTKSGNSAMMWSSLKGHKQMTAWLLDVSSHGEDTTPITADKSDLCRDANIIGATPMMASVKNGHMDNASLLYEKGARLDIGESDKDGRCAMSYACINNDGSAVKWLQEKFEENKAKEEENKEESIARSESFRDYGIDSRK